MDGSLQNVDEMIEGTAFAALLALCGRTLMRMITNSVHANFSSSTLMTK